MKTISIATGLTLIALLVPTAASANQISTNAESGEFAECQEFVREVVDSPEGDESNLPESEEVQFVCLSNIVTVEATDSNGEPQSRAVALNSETDAIVRIPEEQAASEQVNDELEIDFGESESGDSSEEESDGATEEDSGGSVNPIGPLDPYAAKDSYRMNKSDKIVWGVKRGKKVVWSRSSKLSLSSLTGNVRKSTLWLTSDPTGNYQTAIEARIVLKEHLRLRADPSIDWGSIKQAVYSAGPKKHTVNLYNDKGAAKYYHYVHDMKMNDRSENRKFNISGSISMQRFQCYKTVVCKFPGGKQAPY